MRENRRNRINERNRNVQEYFNLIFLKISSVANIYNILLQK